MHFDCVIGWLVFFCNVGVSVVSTLGFAHQFQSVYSERLTSLNRRLNLRLQQDAVNAIDQARLYIYLSVNVATDGRWPLDEKCQPYLD